ncbi:hypothetical protein IMG5_099010 [Ichthyophthirius multifiliis]|uniref:Transmembrane protein n=1 Tax=Ichthyophthirius multifiliis TaxID=5932 RepID=G0QS35_ICHMU|nr:hypothetical protein IMG5_099010 [Ichthyophthirius multifiliis]EGR31977.1 hypothetical protein IMG5_099010 [Ichthyophthirius multifiliis]|eukprot:XP_004035463.1 hypothetical protein IMG5_099010 [Ichthyophthirius multifiliis]
MCHFHILHRKYIFQFITICPRNLINGYEFLNNKLTNRNKFRQINEQNNEQAPSFRSHNQRKCLIYNIGHIFIFQCIILHVLSLNYSICSKYDLFQLYSYIYPSEKNHLVKYSCRGCYRCFNSFFRLCGCWGQSFKPLSFILFFVFSFLVTLAFFWNIMVILKRLLKGRIYYVH